MASGNADEDRVASTTGPTGVSLSCPPDFVRGSAECLLTAEHREFLTHQKGILQVACIACRDPTWFLVGTPCYSKSSQTRQLWTLILHPWKFLLWPTPENWRSSIVSSETENTELLSFLPSILHTVWPQVWGWKTGRWFPGVKVGGGAGRRVDYRRTEPEDYLGRWNRTESRWWWWIDNSMHLPTSIEYVPQRVNFTVCKLKNLNPIKCFFQKNQTSRNIYYIAFWVCSFHLAKWIWDKLMSLYVNAVHYIWFLNIPLFGCTSLFFQ